MVKNQYDTCVLNPRFIQDDYPYWIMPLQTIGKKRPQARQINSLHGKRSYKKQGQDPQNIRNIFNINTFNIKLDEHLLNCQWHLINATQVNVN